MRNVLKSSAEVFHYWANKVQTSGRVVNAFFDGDYVYSYGKHFCIARHLPNGAVAFTTRGYSNTTAKQISQAKQAANHLTRVYCNDPSDSALQNMRYAQQAIVSALDDAEKPRIRQATKDGHKACALHLAEQANAYLAALPETEREGATQFDISGLEHIRAVMQAHEETRRRLAADAAIARDLEAAERLKAWRVDPTIHTQGFYGLPVALRFSNSAGDSVIQTSHGAEIPLSFAPRLWKLITACRVAGRATEKLNQPCGHYTLNTVRADGSIVVGCHDIAFSEIERIAVLLGYVQSVETV